MKVFDFRPWVRKTGLTIVVVAALMTAFVISAGFSSALARMGWVSEPFVAAYLAVLWIGGARVYFGTFKPIAELHPDHMLLRPLHVLTAPKIPWEAVEGTEQMIRGDRMILYFRGARGLRHVALNLNLVKGRREFLQAVEARLVDQGFRERIVNESRYLSRPRIDDGSAHPSSFTASR